MTSLSVSPANVSISLGRPQQFVASATYSDATTKDVTALAEWSSSLPSVIGVGTGTTPGLASPNTIGVSIVSAWLDTFSASSTVTVERTYWRPYASPAWDGPTSAIVTASNGDTLVAANGTGVYKSADGKTWVFLGSPSEPGIETLLWSGTSLYAGTHNGVFVSADEGATWTTAAPGMKAGICVFALADSQGYLYAATDQGLYRSLAGSAWVQVISSNEFRALFVTSSGTLLAGSTSGGNGGGPGGDIWTSTDGANWTHIGIANAWSFRAFGQDPAGTLYAGAFYKGIAPGGLYTSSDGGTTWTGPVLGSYSVQAITTCGQTVYLGTREGILFAGPQNWQAIANPSGKAILALAYPWLGSDGVYRLDNLSHPVLGSTPEITQVLTDSQGTTYWRSSYFGVWSSLDGYIGPSGVEAAWQLDDLMFLNAAGELVAFDENAVFHRVSHGWVRATFPTSPVPGRFYAYVVLPDRSIILSDVNDGFWQSSDGGSSFISLGKSAFGVVFALWYSNGLLYSATELNNVAVSSDSGQTWTALPVFLPGTHNMNTYAVTTTGAGTLLAGRAGGTPDGCLFRYVSGGWQRSDTGIPAQQTVYSLYSNSWATYAVTGAGMFESLDDGVTWSLMSGLPPFSSAYTAEFRPIVLTPLSDGHFVLGVHWEGRGAYVSAP